MTRILMALISVASCFCRKHRPLGRLGTLSDVTVVTLHLPLYSSQEWRTPSLSTLAVA